MTCRRSLPGSPIYFLALVSTWRTLSGGIRCLFEDFDTSLDSEGIRRRERLRTSQTSGVELVAVIGSSENGGLTRVADASGTCSGGEQTMKRTSGGRGAAVISSIEVVVAVAIYTP